MDWETIVWIAIALSGLLIVAGFFTRPVQSASAPAAHPLRAWLEMAYPVFFIAMLGMLALKSIMSFAGVMLLATAITGLIWAIDKGWLRKKRTAGAAEPIVVEMARSFFPVILVVFLLRSFLFEPFKIPSGSMIPSLLVGDFILVNKYTYGIRLPVINKKIVEMNSPQRGDVMVFRYPEDPTKDFIKRVVGLPGDKVSYQNKRLTINDQVIPTESTGTITEVDGQLQLSRYETFTEKLASVPHKMMINPERPAIGLGAVRQFPNLKKCEYNESGVTCTVPPGHYFMMGDNRDNSDDSRYWGFVPEGNIVGKAFLVWMNFSAMKRIGMSIQ